VYADAAVDVLRRRLPADQPLFLMVSFDAPHHGSPAAPDDPEHVRTTEPPPRYRDAFEGVRLPRPPSFNEPDLSDKPAELQQSTLKPPRIAEIEEAWQQRMEALMAVDDAVARIVAAVEASGELDSTVIVFSSDNGFLLGEHRVQEGKRIPYDEAVHLPLLIRGPGFPVAVDSELRLSADLTSTFVQLAGATPTGHELDGKPLDAPPRSDLLIEGYEWSALRTSRFYYVRYWKSGAEQLYDLTADPWQLRSLHADPAYARVVVEMKARLTAVRNCAGDGCP
jgi:arylsulfatase A-like enzyme